VRLALAASWVAVALPMLLPPTAQAQVEHCVARYGSTGCAARLYAQELCNGFDKPDAAAAMQSDLTQQFEQAEIDFNGLSAAAIETAAIRYYTPMLCPERSGRIQQLFESAPPDLTSR
jgi:hypothetical protein